MRYLILGVVAISLMLAVSDRRLLIWQDKAEVGQHYYVDGYGDLYGNAQASLVCSYWTGWSIKKSVFWYDAGGFMGSKDQCPLIYHAG